MGFEVIKSREKWTEIVGSFDRKDIYYTYEYCSISAQLEEGKALLIYFENDLGAVIYPVIKREIASSYLKKVYDIITPYGYGGPVVQGNKEVLKEFRKVFLLYCRKENIISEVITFHPLYNNAEIMDSYCELKYVRKTTAVDLSDDIQSIRSQYTGMNKRNIKKARKSGLICKEVCKSTENINIFLNLYNKTMDRQNASLFYYFTFEVIEENLKDTSISKSHLLFVYFEGKVIAATLLFTTANLAHYHLGASHIDYLNLRPNNLIFDYMIELSKENGCTYLHLGGGYQENDGLFHYKCSFTNNNVFNYYIGKKIINDEKYHLLVNEKKKNYKLNESYFPLYRANN